MPLFPFPKIRSGQKEFMDDIETALIGKRHLVAHASTGIGKTAAVLSVALPFAIENGKDIFFLAPKHTQHSIVIETLKKIKEKYNVNFRVADIIGKQWLCPVKAVDVLSSREFNQFCSTRKKNEECGYYNKIFEGGNKISCDAKDVINEVKNNILHSHEVKLLCRKKELCPYEICVKAGSESNVIIADYYHIFSPKVRHAFLMKLNKDLGNAILVVDEAHNLPERIRNILSYNLSEYTLSGAIKEARIMKDSIEDDFLDIIDILKKFDKEKLKKEGKFKEAHVRREEFTDEISRFANKMHMTYDEFYLFVDAFGDGILKIPNRYRSHAKTVARFLESWSNPDIGFARILKKNKNSESLELSYKCLDPSVSSAGVFSEAYCAILMSGTLVPLNMYSSILGLENPMEKEYTSPYPKENKLVLITPGVTTQWKARSDEMYDKYAEKLKNMIDIIPGNVAVFFPSYDILKKIHEVIKDKHPISKSILAEKQDMKKDERNELYNSLINYSSGKGSVLLGVQAGSMSEGMDYPKNALSAVIIVGLPLGIPDLETQSLIEYYDFKFNMGMDYGYIYPAMTKALQSAGRGIRSETDRGAIIFMDERFKWKNYAKYFPNEFEPNITDKPEVWIKKFFGV